MTEYSFPVVDEPMTADQWSAVTLGIGSGILDTGGGPYFLANFSNVSNTVDVTVSQDGYAQAIVAGFYHKMDADVTLSIPAVSSPTTYHIALQYDPLRAAMPVQLGAFTELDRSQGKQYVVLHEIDREPDQLLTDATRRWVRPRVTPTIMVSRPRELPPASSVLWGTVGICHGGSINEPDILVAKSSSESEANEWVSVLRGVWEDCALAAGRTSGVSEGYSAQILRSGNRRELRGRVGRTGGASFTPVGVQDQWSLVNLSTRDRPSRVVGGIGNASGFEQPAFVRLEIIPDGVVLGAPSDSTTWIGLDGLVWYVD